MARLAQYRPFEHDGLNGRAALIDLVLAVALEADGQLPALRECQDNCQTLWGLEIELDELREILDALVANGTMTRSNGHFALEPGKLDELADRLKDSEALERQAFEDWEVSLRSLNPGLTVEDVAELRADLVTWLERLIKRHGVESALILYPEIQRAQELFAKINDEGLNFLPKRTGRVQEIREQALYLFVRQPTEAQRTLLATLLNTAYTLTILTLDPSAGALVQTVTTGQRVYLDTNFIYRVLNLQGPRLYLSSKRLLALTQQLGYETAVTPWTVTELKSSLERARDFLMKQPLPPAELAELAASATTDENFVTAYWIRLKESPVSPKDFYEFHAQIEVQLAEHGITVIDEGCKAVDRDEAGISDELSALDRVLGYYDKHEEVKLHDVKHRLLVRRLRGGLRRFSNAGYWFLTCDGLLPRYDQAATRADGELTFCATAGAWFQVMRSFTPRTADFEQTLSDLLASPYIRYRGRIGYKTVEEVVARIDLYEGRTPELAAKVLLDTALMRDVARTQEEEKRRELIDNAVVRAAADRERELEESREREQLEREKRREAEARERDLSDELEAERLLREADEREERAEIERLRQERLAVEAAAAVAAAQHDEELASVAQELEGNRAELTELHTKLDNRRRNLKIALSALVLVVVLGGTIAALATGAVTGGWPITILLIGATAVACGALIPHVGHKRVWAGVVVFGVVLGIVVAIHQLVGKSDGGTPKPPPATTN